VATGGKPLIPRHGPKPIWQPEVTPNALVAARWLHGARHRGPEPEAQPGSGEKIGDFADGVVERRIVIGHERSPVETTHNDLRFAVEALSGGLPLTIYAESLESVRFGGPRKIDAGEEVRDYSIPIALSPCGGRTAGPWQHQLNLEIRQKNSWVDSGSGSLPSE
jgi:hypothetical protein